MTKNYLWKDNPTEANVAVYDPDILNECLMHLKYNDNKLTRFCVNSASTDASGQADLLTYSGDTLSFKCGSSFVPVMTSNSQGDWALTSSHSINTSSNDIYKSFDENSATYCALQHCPTAEEPSYISLSNTSAFTFDYLYLKFSSVWDVGAIKAFHIKDNENNTLFSYDNSGAFLDKDTFLIPLGSFSSSKIYVYATSNVNNVNYVNFPAIIKLLDKSQVISLTNAQGQNAVLVDIDNITFDTDGTYNVYLGLDGTTEILTAPLTTGVIMPASPITNQVHHLVNGEPACTKKYNGTLWLNYDKVYVGKVVVSNNTITSAETNPYNCNGYNINKINGRVVIESYVNGAFWYRIYSDGWIEQGGQSPGASYGGSWTNFVKPFASSCFSVVGTTFFTGLSDIWGFGLHLGDLNTSGFRVYSGQPNAGYPIRFIACGY